MNTSLTVVFVDILDFADLALSRRCNRALSALGHRGIKGVRFLVEAKSGDKLIAEEIDEAVLGRKAPQKIKMTLENVTCAISAQTTAYLLGKVAKI